ncbi:hypothetical protein [Bosea sp. 124]|nr:hypothetical protein [Bosea sp. 124]
MRLRDHRDPSLWVPLLVLGHSPGRGIDACSERRQRSITLP